MGTFTRTVRIAAPPAAVWALLADVGGIATWNPNLRASRSLAGPAQGVGARRHCDFAGEGGMKGFVRERVTAWRPERSLVLEIYESDQPMKRATATFQLQARSGGDVTEVAVTMDYRLKGGPLGAVMDALMARRQFEKAIDRLLDGLRQHAEGKAPKVATLPAR